MIRTINTFIIAVLLIAFVLWVVFLNASPTTIYLTGSKSFTIGTGFALVGAFIIGFACMGLVALFFGLKHWFKEKRFNYKERNFKAFYDAFVNARELTASQDWNNAKEAWHKIIRKDPTNIVARIEFAKALTKDNQINEAIKVLDAARAIDPNNAEVLSLTASLHELNNNKTAAIDNLALLLYSHPSKYAAKKARDLSEDLERINDALEYQNELEKFGGQTNEDKETVMRLDFKKALYDYKDSEREMLKKQLLTLYKRKNTYPLLLKKLSSLEEETGNFDAAAQYLYKAYKVSGKECYLEKALNLWTNNNLADNAISVVRNNTRETSGSNRLKAELDLINALIKVNKLSEAKSLIDNFSNVALKEETKPSDEFSQRLLILKGLCLSRMNEYKESSEIWQKLSQTDYELEHSHPNSEADPNSMLEPSPQLSTP